MKTKLKNNLLSVIVPVYNEIANIRTLHESLLASFKEAKQRYEIIYIDDHSTDGTYEYIRCHEWEGNVKIYRKEGRKGKAFSLIEGFSYAKGSILAMIDADLQYPPQILTKMVEDLEKADVVVANRKNFQAPLLRKIASRGFRAVFGQVLFGLNTDVQSGMKVFKRVVYEAVKFRPLSPWTFDLEFLYRSREAGFTITNHDITFAPREQGNSNIRLLQQSLEIGANALHVKLKKIKPFLIPPVKNRGMIGAGIGFKKRQYITHTTLPADKTAMVTFTLPQILLIILALETTAIGFLTVPLLTIRILVGLLSFIYFIDVVFNLFIIMRSMYKKQELQHKPSELAALDESQMPVYSILCPLYKEAAILPQFLKAIDKLDWPKDKLDVMLLLEKDDVESIKKIMSMKLPAYVRPVIVPPSMPKTKPKACNYGLSLAKGEYIVIYDAEDIPDPMQLKKAYLGFLQLPDHVACLQAKLNYYNPNQNWLTRFFTAEYSLWFDLTLTGFQSIETSIPLGGTSNHFKTNLLRQLKGWDTFNVTEDADLGIRLFKAGYSTAIIDSVTLEEANSAFKNWIRQRSRWIKGYMQSYLVHVRDIVNFAWTKGIHALLFQATIGCKLTFIFLNPFLWVVTTAYFTMYAVVGPTIEMLYVAPVFYLSIVSLVFGNFLFLYYYMAGCAQRNQWELMKYILFIPIYWVMISLAGWVAFYQLLFKPHYWEKTVHGLHLKKKAKDQAGTEIVVSIDQAPIIPDIKRAFNFNQKGFISYSLFFDVFKNNISALFKLFDSKKRKASASNQAKPKPAILIFNWRDTRHSWAGGAEVYIQEIAKRWVKAGSEVTVFCGNDGVSAQNEVIDGVQILRRGGVYMVYIWAFLYYMFKFRGKYDIIIDCENGIPFFTPLYVRKSVFLLIHHVHQEVFRQHLVFPLSTIATFLESVCMPLVYRNKQIITVSSSSKKEILKLGFPKSDNIEVIFNGLNPEMYQMREKTAHPSFIYLGRLKSYKNIDKAILAFSEVVRKYPTSILHIVGQGEHETVLKNLVKELKLDKKVVFNGHVSEKVKAQLLAQSWVMVQPSMMEGWGLTVIEANASATPVIASKVNGLIDSVIDGQTGILVKPGSIHEMQVAMEQLLADTWLLGRLSVQAQQWARHFTWDNSAATFYQLVEKTLAKHSPVSVYNKLALAEGK